VLVLDDRWLFAIHVLLVAVDVKVVMAVVGGQQHLVEINPA